MNLDLKIKADIIQALKNKEEQKVSSLRFLMAQIKDKEISQARKKLSDSEIIKLISRQIKKLEDSLVFFEKAERKDLIAKTKKEIAILKPYLPKQLSDEELEQEIKKIIGQNPKVANPGILIGISVKALAGKADNKRIAQILMKNFKK